METYNDSLVFLVTSLHPEGIQEPTKSCLIRTEDLRNSKRFSNFVSGNRAKGQLKQEMFLVLLPLKS